MDGQGKKGRREGAQITQPSNLFLAAQRVGVSPPIKLQHGSPPPPPTPTPTATAT